MNVVPAGTETPKMLRPGERDRQRREVSTNKEGKMEIS